MFLDSFPKGGSGETEGLLGGDAPSPETKKATPASGVLESSLTDDGAAKGDGESKGEVI